MPSPKHKCAHPDCTTLVSPKAAHCRRHVPRTPEWIAKQALTQQGKKLTALTRRKISEAKSGQVETICEWCNEKFMVKPYRLKKGQGKYCSSKCAYAARSGENSPFWNGGLTTYTCELCGKEFQRHECFVNGETIACSYSCSSILKKAKQRNNKTGIERIMAEALTHAGYQFEEQVPLCNITVADFYLPHLNAAVFCDGDYWHNFPHGKDRDHEQTKVLQDNEITVFHFWGSVINSDISSCIERINSLRVNPC